MFNNVNLPNTMSDVVHPLPEENNIDLWRKHANMDFDIKASPLAYNTSEGIKEYKGRRVLYRSDTLSPLGAVSDSYKVVQPNEILKFFQDIVGQGGYRLETAGTFLGGKRFWAMASTSHKLVLNQEDNLQGYLLLASSADGKMSTQVFFTSIRMVCLNQLNVALKHKSLDKPFLKIPHNAVFNPDVIKDKLMDLNDGWDKFSKTADLLASRKVSRKEIVQYFVDVLYPNQEGLELEKVKPKLELALQVYQSAPGQQIITSRDTAWGLLNAVTRLTDHDAKSRTNDSRIHNAYIGQGLKLKDRAWNLALDLLK